MSTRLRLRRAQREAAASAVRVDAPAVRAGRAVVRDVLVRGGGFARRDLRPRGAAELLQVQVEVRTRGRAGELAGVRAAHAARVLRGVVALAGAGERAAHAGARAARAARVRGLERDA